MKKLLCLAICVPLLVHAQNQKGIQFEEGLSWQQVKDKAKAANKYIFMDVYTTWCAPCKLMDKEVYPNDTVGSYMIGKFISVKVQMDSTGKDNEQVKRWYNDARAIEREYKIDGFPGFFFFNPEGTLIYRDLGYKNVADFLQLANKALDPKNIVYYSLLEDYKKGKKDYEKMHDLAVYTKNTLGNDTLARQMAEDYINHVNRKQLLGKEKIFFVSDVAGNSQLADSLAAAYKDNILNKLNEDEFCTSENIRFIERFNHLITSKDQIFEVSYSSPEKIDSLLNFKGAADFYVHATIAREEIKSRLFRNDKPVFENPDWNGISAIIKEKYPKVNIQELLLNYQRFYYSQLKDCTQWAKYQDEIIKSYQANPTGTAKFYELNDLGAWEAFLRCNDEKVLAKALEWIDLAIRLSESDPDANVMAFLDTRANILYKLGRVKEAIAQEEKAVETGLVRSEQENVNLQTLMPAIKELKEVIEKMKKREPTYLEQGAVWDVETLKKIQRGKARRLNRQ